MECEIEDFLWMSKYAGMREDMVQAGGGNSSYKQNPNTMLIKASGFQLADITEDKGIAVVDPHIIEASFKALVESDSLNEIESKKIIDNAFIKGGKPSIETFLHSCMGKYALHTHPTVVNALMCLPECDRIVKELFPEALFVPYATPGIKLAREYFNTLSMANRDADIVFLQNHGLIVGGEEASEVIDKTEYILRTIEKYLGVDNTVFYIASELYKYLPSCVIWSVNDVNVLKLYEQIGIWDFAICPDSVVFLGKRACVIENDCIDVQAEINKFISENGSIGLIEYKGYLYLVAKSVKMALEMQSVLSHCAQVKTINIDRKINLIENDERDFLINWDVEKYRRDMK